LDAVFSCPLTGSGAGGKVVKNPKQGIAIAMSEAKMPMRGQRTAKNKAKK
jgi:hypothetical protein